MIIKEIDLYNFRIYKGPNKIELKTNGKQNIFIVSGRNGFGKTTFLMSMVWCLYGRQMQDVDDIYKKEIDDQGGYSKYISNSLNRLAKAEDDYKFHVSITFINVNIPEVPCKEIKITRSYNIKTSTSEEVEVLIDGHASELAKDVGQEIFIREFIMPIEIAKFFFFDAEKIVTLAEVNTPEQKRKLSKAYSEVLGIRKYEDLRGELEGLQNKLRQESANATEKAQLRQLEGDVESCVDKIAENDRLIDELKEKKSEKSKESRDIQEKLIKSGSLITVEELHEFRLNEESLNNKLTDLQNRLKESYDIIPFAIAGEQALEVSKQLENEANFKAAQYKDENVKGVTNRILTDLYNAKPKDLVIDHQIQKYYAETFDALIRKHFFEDTPSLPSDFKMIHEFSESERNELLALLNNLKSSFKESFKRITADYNLTKNELNAIRKRIRDAESNQEDPIIAEYRKNKDLIDREVMKIEGEIESLQRENGAKDLDKVQKGKKIDELSKKLNVSEKNRKKDEIITHKIKILKHFITEFKARKKQSLETQLLSGLDTLMHKKDFIKKVEVAIIGDDIDIVLRNSRNEEIRKESLSKGEQQMYATALLRGLVEESDIQFPVFIDSPMQKFDEQHAENIVRYFYPHVSDQVVIFPLINKELTEKEFNILYPYIANTYLINNVHEDKSEFVPVEPSIFLTTYNKMYNHAD